MRSTVLISMAAVLSLAACANAGPTRPLAPTAPELDRGGYQGTRVAPRARPIRMDMTLGQDFSQGTCDVEVPTGDPENPTILVRLPRLAPAWGTASHMGRVRQEIWHDECGFGLHDGLPVIEFGGHFLDRAANGSTEGTWSGYLYLAGEQAGQFFNTAVITGGTGRFENASGDLAIQGWKDLGQGTEPSWYKGQGTIYY